jgi:LysM repeat protein
MTMNADSSRFTKKIHQLSIALVASGMINIFVLSFLIYWTLSERPPTPYCELKPATIEQQQIPLADQRGCAEVLQQLSQLSFSQLIRSLSHTQLIENGYAERDLALACLVAYHHFDIDRALPKNLQPEQKRYLAWKGKNKSTPSTLVVYPDLSEKQYEIILQFAKTEHWPLTSEGLFLVLQEMKKNNQQDATLEENFLLTPEFWAIELLFNRSEQSVSKQEILALLVEGTWPLIKRFYEQQKNSHDTSLARRQKFLLDYLKENAKTAAVLLLQSDWDFAVKKIDDEQAVAILHLMPQSFALSNRFAKEMLASPRGTAVWQKASQWLFDQVGEFAPKDWNYEAALARFISEKPKVELIPSLIKSNEKEKPKVGLPLPKMISTAKNSSFTLEKNKSVVKKEEQIKKKKPQLYVVQQGDSLWKIARRYEINVQELKVANGLQTDHLKPGIVLTIPTKEKT